MKTSFNARSPFSRSLTRLPKPGVNEANMSQFLIPLPSKMDMTGDLVSNWEFFRDSWKNYATATKLAHKDKKIVAATLLSIMGKECLWVCRNLPMTADERQDADVILTKLANISYRSEIRSTNAMCLTLVPRKPMKASINSCHSVQSSAAKCATNQYCRDCRLLN